MKTIKLSCLVVLLCLASLQAQAKPPTQQLCTAAQYGIFDRLLGSWKIYALADDMRTLLGSLQTHSVARGCALKQVFAANGPGVSSESLAYLDNDGAWKVIYTADDGEVSRFRWEQNEEELIKRKIANPGPQKKRLVAFDIRANQYSVVDERSDDYGQTWQQHSLQVAVRVPPVAIKQNANTATIEEASIEKTSIEEPSIEEASVEKPSDSQK